MKEFNILFLSAGRRVELIKQFKEAANELNIKSKLISVDSSPTAPAFYFTDAFYIVPSIHDNEYVSTLIKICHKENIHLIIPTIDWDLLRIAQNKEKIENETNAKVLVSNEDVISICLNKMTTHEFFEKKGFDSPNIISNQALDMKDYVFPLFIKPFDGSSSIHSFKVNSNIELDFFRQYVKNPMVQEFIDGEEFTIDAFLDFNSKILSIVPRKRMAVRSGEISKGMISKDQSIINQVKELLDTLKPIGQVTIQCFKTKDSIKFIEINPRFGGGAPMSFKAGANSAIAIYQLLMGYELSYSEDYEDELLCLRYDQTVYIHQKSSVIS